MTQATKTALQHMGVVFLYSGISSVLPVLLAYVQNDPRWTILIPVINSAWYAIARYLKERNLIDGDVGQKGQF